MPCRYDPTSEEVKEARERREQLLRREIESEVKGPFQEQLSENNRVLASDQARIAELEAINNVLSVKIDELHELILNCVDPDDLPNGVFESIRSNQVNHRQADLDKLLSNAGKLTPDQIRRVVKANPDHSLEPQLGFNPDDY